MDPRNTQSDERLLEHFQNGDQQAFETLVRRHADRSYRIAVRVLYNCSEADDIVQNAFLKLWQRPHLCKLDKTKRFSSWFYRVLVNACIDKNRRGRHNLFDTIDGLSLPADNPPSTSEEERRKVVEAFVQDLPDRQRTALVLCYYEGFTNQEAADIMEIRLKALQSLIVRAKTKLKNQIKPQLEWHH